MDPNVRKNRMARRIVDVNGSNIGILVNDRDNADLLARETAKFYQRRHQCTVVEFINKQATEPCVAEHLLALSKVCDFLITAIGDSESSAACVVQDSISFEQYGKPALTLCSKPFRSSAEDAARELGLPAYPFVAVTHPIAAIASTEITERAVHAYRQGMAFLTGMHLLIG
tara:strand:- start:3868 stop:4380 length:513 start_codon:yes stop_codon:yes gene_type:complete